MNLREFSRKWSRSTLTERSAAQQHFLDLCALVGHPTPAAMDPGGESFTFEKGAATFGGGQGWADVWKRGCFAFEYKGKDRDLDAAYRQLLQYRDSLENPPLLIVCDMARLVVHTNFTGTPTQKHVLSLDESALDGETAQDALAQDALLEQLRNIFFHPERFKPRETIEKITERAASKLGGIARTMGARYEPTAVARFLDRIVFCLFAEDIDLLPGGLFARLLEANRFNPERCSKLIGDLFLVMEQGGDFGEHPIRRFNGNLFHEELRFALTQNELDAVRDAAKMDWKNVDPSIFGTLFERGLDPEKRSQLGAHYTSRADIETLIEPVVLAPLRREWDEVRAKIEAAGRSPHPTSRPELAKEGGGVTPLPPGAGNPHGGWRGGQGGEAAELIRQFLARLSGVRVLDPACGSGNFLYVALQKLKDLEKAVLTLAHDHELGDYAPTVSPEQLFGIELNAYAFDLAQTTVWIGYLQWLRGNGYLFTEDPVLRKTDNFRSADAILDLSDPEKPREPQWPQADFIVGNPPFLGNKRMRSELGGEYCACLWKLYGDHLPATSDLCCYWFEKARQMIADGQCQQAGLIATTAIKQVGARRVLERINDSGRIFFAVSDRDWLLGGASVRISIVGFAAASDGPAILDGQEVARINADLTAGHDLTRLHTLKANAGLCFMGTTKVGAFDIEEKFALQLLSQPNPHGKPNSDVLRPFRNGSDIVQKPSHRWIVDFGVVRPVEEAALYEAPFEYLVKNVKPEREQNKRASRAERWWLLGETIPAFRAAMTNHTRYIAIPRVAKHRIFVWLDAVVLPDSKVIAVALSDDFNFGVLHSRVHEVWTLATSGLHGGERPTYNPTTCFETFPFPKPAGEQREAIAKAARELDTLRGNWLSPPEWTREELLEFPGSVDGPWARYVHDADSRGIGTVRYPRRVPRDAILAMNLVRRTLTNLYNERPAWLDNAHRKLDAAVFAAYGWPETLSDDDILEKLLALNQARGG